MVVPRRSSSTSTTAGGRYQFGGAAGLGGTVSWNEVNGPLLLDCIAAVTSAGDGVLFGRTSDGGALTLWLLSGGETSKFYAHGVDEVETLLQSALEAAQAALK